MKKKQRKRKCRSYGVFGRKQKQPKRSDSVVTCLTKKKIRPGLKMKSKKCMNPRRKQFL